MANNPLQIIFLFDLNAYSDLRPRSGPELHRKLLWLRLSCLRILTHYSNNIPSLKWGFKFFDSRGKITQTMCKFFFPLVTLESYETLENEITSQYLRHASYLEAIAESSRQDSDLCLDTCADSPNQKSTMPVQLLQLALDEMLGEFQWESSADSFSPCVKSRFKKERKNLLFYISRCAKDENEFKEFFGSDFSSMNSIKLSKLLLSPSLLERLLDQASTKLIWFNISEKITPLANCESVILKMLSEALKSMDCTLLLQSALPQSTQILKFKEENNKSIETCNIKELTSSILPFSTVFLQSVAYPFYTNDWEKLCSESSIIFHQKDKAIPILLNNVPLSWNRKKSNLSEDCCPSKMQHWSKMNVYFAVSRYTLVKSSDQYLCIPNMRINTSSCQMFQQLNVSLLLNNVNLFIICESCCGAIKPGLYTPVTDTSAIISILTEKSCYFLIEKEGSSNTLLNCIKDTSLLEVQKKVEKCFPNLVLNSSDSMDHLKSHLTTYQPFQLECLENWFHPQTSIPSVFENVNLQEQSSTAVDEFHSQLLKSIKKDVNEESAEQPDKTETNVVIAEKEELPTDIKYEDLIAKLLQMFNNVIENNGNTLQAAKRIVKYASSFFLQQSIISYEKNLRNFMTEYFLTTYQKLSEKYNEDSDTNKQMMVTECQMQVFFPLEMEILFPSMECSTCVGMVTYFLREMSFIKAFEEPGYQNKFLLEVLKPNYGHVLQPILSEIENEFTTNYYSDEDSTEESSDLQFSQSMQDNLDSASLSAKSAASSISSNKSDKKRVSCKRSDIFTRKSHEVVLPSKSLRKKKSKSTSNVDKIPIRYSPRLASKRKRELHRSIQSEHGSVKRNLFPKDKKPQTPRKNRNHASPLKKMKPTTPKGHHVLKTQFVPETPGHKQRHSSIYRRMSQADVTPSKEVANSPSISKKAKDSSHLKLLQQLKERYSQSASTVPRSSASLSLPSCSYQVAKTPQSKNRLSLKLFSKLLASPTARMGFKKCSKRLFEEDSPRADRSKRIKLFEDQEKNANF